MWGGIIMNSFFVGLQFLTRLKIVNQTNWEMRDFGKSVVSFPLVGCIIGLFTYLVYVLLYNYIPHQLLMVLLVILEFLFTGGLHADGFMDTCDGLFSGRDRERKLEIMKDSRIGSNGVVGFVFLVLLKWQLLVSIPHEWMLLTLISLPLLSRYTMCFSITAYPYARPQGMGKAFAEFAPKYTLLYTTVMAFMPAFYFGLAYGIMFISAIAINIILNRYIVKHLGGTTGDTYGFVTELTELLLLVVVIASITIGL